MMVAVALVALALDIGAPIAAEETFGLTRPIRLVSAHAYSDGGTVGFVLMGAGGKTLRGGFDGRIQFEDSPPHQCFLGSEVKTDKGVRFLPLWGAEERALVSLVVQAIDDSLRERADATVFEDELRQLKGKAESRRLTLEALDQGLLAIPDWVLRYYQATSPIKAESIVVDPNGKQFVIAITDAQGTAFLVSFPATKDRVMNKSAMLEPKYREYGAGWQGDRMLMTFVWMALRADTAGVAGVEPHGAELLALLQLRRTKILGADAKR